MCYLSWEPDDFNIFHSDPSLGLRPHPRLVWAIPVDVVELGTSLTAYENQLPTVTALQLCHQFGNGALSRLPREILDHIISDAHQAEQAKIRPEWAYKFSCFQSSCSLGHHYYCHDTRVQTEILYDEEEEEVMKDLAYAEYFEDVDCEFDEYEWSIHEHWQKEWITKVCLCKHSSNPSKNKPKFTQLNALLRSHFGLEVIILHEALSMELQSFLPYHFASGDVSLYTSCFLALPSKDQDMSASRGRSSTHDNLAFLKKDNHLAFHQIIDLASLNISDEQKTYFTRAMRILKLNPAYHLTELDAVIVPTTKDKLLWEICASPLDGCPKPTEEYAGKKMEKLKQYIKNKNKELAEQSWPKLMNIASSNVVSPHRL